MIPQPVHHESRLSLVYSGHLEPVDTRQSSAFGYRESVAIERYAYDQAIDRDDDPEHVDHNARTVEVLWKAKVALDAHPTGLRLPFTIWLEKADGPDPAGQPAGDSGARRYGRAHHHVALSHAVPFTVNPNGPELPAVALLEFGSIRLPVVTVSVLHVLLAALTDSGIVAAFHVQDAPDNPVRISTYDGRSCTLVAHRDGTYSIGMLHRYCTTAT